MCWLRVMNFFAVLALSPFAVGRLLIDLPCDSFLSGNETCVYSSTHNFAQRDLDISYDGNIMFIGAHFTLRFGNLSVQAKGTVTLDQASELQVTGGNLEVKASNVRSLNKSSLTTDGKARWPATGSIMVVSRDEQLYMTGQSTVSGISDVSLQGNGVSLSNGASVAAKGQLVLGGSCKAFTKEAFEFDDICNNSIQINFANINAQHIDFCCRGSDIKVYSNSVVSTLDPYGSIELHANWILLDTGSTLATTSLSVHAVASANITGDLPGFLQVAGHRPSWRNMGQPQFPTAVNLSVLGHLTLGHSSDTGHQVWHVNELRAIADNILVQRGLTISTNMNSSSCNNEKSPVYDVCADIRNGVPVDPGYGSKSHVKVTYDFLLAAKEDLEILDNTNIKAASMMICAGRTTSMKDGVVLDARGRGCGPGDGPGRGETREPYVGCGGGGGSHIGKGGNGAVYDEARLDTCSSGGPINDKFVPGYLPSQGASGGGCGVPQPCSRSADYPMLHSSQHPSAGGGLIWLSTANLAICGKVEFAVDGKEGVAVPNSESPEPTELLSGGGAGGQVLMFVSKFRFAEAEEFDISATGGDGFCKTDQASGAGGGGFVGLMWDGGTPLDADVTAVTNVYINGGGVDPDCEALVPHAYMPKLMGAPGLATGMKGCSPGFSGMFCSACPVGAYKSDQESVCQQCTNKPYENAVYAGSGGWPNSSCPYQCAPSVPNIKSNPHCLDAFRYAMHLYGGTAGLLCILAVLILVTIFLLFRRTSCAKRIFSPSGRDTQSFAPADSDGQQGSLLCRCFSKCVGCLKRRDHSQPGGTMQFTREQLPFHIGRVYLNGQNTAANPWLLDDKVPAIVEELVATAVWERFAYECNLLAKVKTKEAYFEQILRFLYPVALPVYKNWCRHLRAKSLCKSADNISHSSETCSIWRPIHSRSMSRLVMIFGYDRGATLGYLDFFDFSRSPFDWAPVDLRREARVVVAHGLGSYAEPFALDTGDPLVHNLAQNTFNSSSAVFSVISTFNRISRLMPAVELDISGTRRHVFTSLCEKVEQCAANCGLADCVQVLLVPQFNMASLELRASTNLDPPRASQTSFSDLIRNHSDRREEFAATVAHHNAGSWEGMQAPSLHRLMEHGSTTTTTNTAQARRKVSLRLCLAFFDRAAAEDSLRSHSPLTDETSNSVSSSIAQHQNAELPQPLGVALTSPMAHAVFGDFIYWQPQLQSENNSSTVHALTSMVYTCRWRVTSCLLSVRLAMWSGRAAALAGTASPPTILLLFILFYFADLMVFLLMGSIYMQLGPGVIALWLLVPPLTQPLAVVLGPYFAFSEHPRLGRLFASFVAFSAMNAIVVTTAVIGIFRESWFFHFLELPIAFSVKAVLFICANVHIGNLEARHDLSFMDTPQADFLGNILTDGAPLPRVASPSVFSEKGLQSLTPLRVQLTPESPVLNKMSSSPINPWSAGVDALPQTGNTSSAKGYVPSPF